MPDPATARERGEVLGGSEYLLFSAAVEGELVPLFAHEYCTPGAPVFFGSEKDHLLFALFARKDELLLWKTLHVYAPPWPPFGASRSLWVWRAVGARRRVTSHTRGTGTRSTMLYFN